MASISLHPRLSISTFNSLQRPTYLSRFYHTRNREKTENTVSAVMGSHQWNLDKRGRGNFGPLRNDIVVSSSPSHPWSKSSYVKMISTSAASDYSNDDNGFPAVIHDDDMNFNMIDHLIHILQQSANNFFAAIQSHESFRNCPVLAKAWVGVDVHAWHKHTACEATVYALLQTVKEMGIAIYGEYGNDPHPVCEILSPKLSILLEDIESQLNIRDPKLVEWFKVKQLPVFTGQFAPLLERQSAEYPTSGVAVIVLAISCTIAIQKLGTEHISCPLFALSVPDMLRELMELLFGLVPMDTLHGFAARAGFEQEFLAHVGSKVLYYNTSSEVIFWVSMAWRRLVVAFQREGVVAKLQNFHKDKIIEKDLATLGLFAFLGRKTRLFLSYMGIKDLEEPLRDFLSYLECGSIFIYPELSSISAYEIFMEVVTEEIGWLDFYAAVDGLSCTDRRRSKHIQAKKEITLSTVFNVCSCVFSSFAHFSNSTQQSLDANVLGLLIRSQNLLNICIEDYWAAYDRLCELPKIEEVGLFETKPSLDNQDIANISVPFKEVHKIFGDSMTRGIKEYMHQRVFRVSKSTSSDKMDSVTLEKLPSAVEIKPTQKSLLGKSRNKLIATSADLLMGTRLLFIDMLDALCIRQKQICGHKLTKRERKKLKRTLTDIISAVPVAILMLIPVSAVGHAAILAVIQKYIPSLIPSPYSSERLAVIKQLKRTKKMDIQSWSNLEVSSSVLTK